MKTIAEYAEHAAKLIDAKPFRSDEVRILQTVIAAAMADARRAALEEAVTAVDDAFADMMNGDKDEGMRAFVDKRIRALLDDDPRPACYCDAPEIQSECPVHGKVAR